MRTRKNLQLIFLLTLVFPFYVFGWSWKSVISGGVIKDNGDINTKVILPPGVSGDSDAVGFLLPGSELVSNDKIYSALSTGLPGISAEDIEREVNSVNKNLDKVKEYSNFEGVKK